MFFPQHFLVRFLTGRPRNQRQPFQFSSMNKVTTYFRESYRELLEKVSWPSWTQLQQSTVIVLVATLLITGIVWAMDLVAQSALKLIYSFFA
jgi:preprotein translocase subunit SecE